VAKKLKGGINLFDVTIRSPREPAVMAVSGVYDGKTGSGPAVSRLRKAYPDRKWVGAYIVANPTAINQLPVGTDYASVDEQELIASEPIVLNVMSEHSNANGHTWTKYQNQLRGSKRHCVNKNMEKIL